MVTIGSNPPKPAFTVTLSVGGCDWDTLVRRLVEEAEHIRMHGPECRSVWGGAGTHGHVQIDRRDVTSESYEAELQTWFLTQKDAARAATTREG